MRQEEVKPAIGLKIGAIGALTFLPGSSHTAVLQIQNPTIKSWTYLIKLFIEATQVAAWTQAVAAGATVNLNTGAIIMPTAEGTYTVTATVVETTTSTNLGIFTFESILIATAPAAPEIEVLTLTWN